MNLWKITVQQISDMYIIIYIYIHMVKSYLRMFTSFSITALTIDRTLPCIGKGWRTVHTFIVIEIFSRMKGHVEVEELIADLFIIYLSLSQGFTIASLIHFDSIVTFKWAYTFSSNYSKHHGISLVSKSCYWNL